jgi:hypothetical protein
MPGQLLQRVATATVGAITVVDGKEGPQRSPSTLKARTPGICIPALPLLLVLPLVFPPHARVEGFHFPVARDLGHELPHPLRFCRLALARQLQPSLLRPQGHLEPPSRRRFQKALPPPLHGFEPP